jgi:transposase
MSNEMKEARRSFSPEFKLRIIERLDAGEGGTALSIEFMIKREILYRWRDAYRAGGIEALRSKPGRPPRGEAQAMAVARGTAGKASELAEAQRQIAELQRKVGRQQLDLDFFKQALRHIEASRRSSDGPGATVSSPKSRR